MGESVHCSLAGREREESRPPLSTAIIVALAGASFLGHVLVSAFGPYGIHRDAFLYMAMGEQLRLWHMDFPPLIAIASRVMRALFGNSIVALRMVPAAASAGLIVIAGLAARELGGRRFAQALACLAALAGAVYLRSAALFQPVALDQLWWTLGMFCLLKLARTDDHRWLLAFGVSMGLGLLTKFSILIFGAAALIGLVLSPSRRWLATPWPWVAALLALAIGSPSIVGQVNLHFPLLGQLSDLREAQLDRVSPLAFLLDQPLIAPGSLLAVIGAFALAASPRWREVRVVGAVGIAAFGLVMALGGKSYYIAPIYPVLFGAGAVVVERLARMPWGRIFRWGYVAFLTAYLVVLLPISLPLMAPASLEAYQVRIGLADRATATNVGGQERIPQDFADMLGWPELVDSVSAVYRELPREDRSRAVILASNYGEAGAIDFYGPALGLPRARAYVGSYWFFGPGELPGEILILVGFAGDGFLAQCENPEPAATVDHPYAVAEQRKQVVYICRQPRMTLEEVWAASRGAN
jgi:4-amino-4-deoxy-L-arabinose transferase-like glycosyltransferase